MTRSPASAPRPPELSILVPAYNEARTVGSVVRGIAVACPNAEIIVVDDGSSDATAAEVQAAALGRDSVRLVRHPVNRGTGAAVRTALAHATGTFSLVQEELPDEPGLRPEGMYGAELANELRPEAYRRIVVVARLANIAWSALGLWLVAVIARRSFGAHGGLLAAGVYAFDPNLLAHYPLSYFNELAGGSRGGDAHIVDSNIDWGQDLYRLARWTREHPGAGLEVAYFGGIDPHTVGLEYTLPPREPSPGRYAISVNFVRGMRFTVVDGSSNVVQLPEGAYSYFQRWEPVDRIGTSIRVYDVSREQADVARRELGLSVPHAAATANHDGNLAVARDRPRDGQLQRPLWQLRPVQHGRPPAPHALPWSLHALAREETTGRTSRCRASPGNSRAPSSRPRRSASGRPPGSSSYRAA